MPPISFEGQSLSTSKSGTPAHGFLAVSDVCKAIILRLKYDSERITGTSSEAIFTAE